MSGKEREQSRDRGLGPVLLTASQGSCQGRLPAGKREALGAGMRRDDDVGLSFSPEDRRQEGRGTAGSRAGKGAPGWGFSSFTLSKRCLRR